MGGSERERERGVTRKMPDFKYSSLPSAASSPFYPSISVYILPRSWWEETEVWWSNVQGVTEQPDREPSQGLLNYFWSDTVTVCVCHLERNQRKPPPRRHDATNETFHNQIAVVGVIALGWWLTRAGIFPEVCCETQHTWLTPDVNVNVGTTQQPTDEATLQLIYDLIFAKITKKPGVMMLLLLSLFNNGGKRGRTSDQLYSISNNNNNNNKINFARFIPNMGITLSLFVLMVMTTWDS